MADGVITGTVNWFSVTKGYGACVRTVQCRTHCALLLALCRRCRRRSSLLSSPGFITRSDGGEDVFVHQARARGPTAPPCARAPLTPSARAE